MTWTKLSDDFPDDCAAAELSDAAFRTHVEGLIWTMRRATDGELTRQDLRRGIETDDPEAAAAELVAADFWIKTRNGWRIVHHMKHQPEPEVVAKRRALSAERQRRHRLKKAGVNPPVEEAQGGGAHSAMTRDVTRDPGRGGSGRVGSASYGTPPTTEGEVSHAAVEVPEPDYEPHPDDAAFYLPA